MKRPCIVAVVILALAAPAFPDETKGADQEQRVAELISVIRRSQLFEHADEWVAAVRELVQIGKPAVPQLAVEMASTEPNLSHRAVAIALRHIGDRRAVPALVHALPKVTIRASDCGVSTRDPTLHLFMEAHDNSESYSPPAYFRVGRPVREIVAALEMLTGHSEGIAIHSHFSLEGRFGGNTPEHHSRGVFLEVADRWDAWWTKHRGDLLTSEEQAWVNDEWPRLLASALPEKELQPLELLVVEGTSGQPLSGVQLRMWAYDHAARISTDSQGRARFELPLGVKQTMILARKEGFVPMRLTWKEGDSLPRQYTLTMSHGSRIGGVVRDEQGQPIGGAAVCIYAPRMDDANLWVHIVDHKTTTDSSGRWTFDGLPSDMEKVTLGVEHDDFLPTTRDFFNPYTYVQHAVEPLRDGTFETVLKRGLTAHGVVTDAAGEPVAGAAVRAVGKHPHYDLYGETTTDAQGQFQYSNVLPGELTLAVQADGFAPQSRLVQFGDASSPLVFQLEPGRLIQGQVLDERGIPIQGAMVAVGTWQNRRMLKYTSRTDLEGCFLWNGAPHGPVELRIAAEGYRIVSLTTSGDETLEPVRLVRQLFVTAHVVDAASGKPLEKFILVPGIVSNGRPHWDRRGATEVTSGQHTVNLDAKTSAAGRRETARAIRIEAEGYLPAISRTFASPADGGTVDFRLQRSPPIAGIVVDPAGEPVRGATVILSTPSQQAYVHEGRQSDYRTDRQVFTTTDDGGRFTLSAEVEPYTLVAIHDGGHARLGREEFVASRELRLQPWGRVEGVVLGNDGEPMKSMVTLRDPHRFDAPDAPQLHYMYNVDAGADGRFVFDRVVPGDYRLGRQIQLGTFYTSSPGLPLHVEPGRTVSLVLGGEGKRDVAGQLKLPADLDLELDWSAAAKLTISPYRSGDAKESSRPPQYERIDVHPDGRFTVHGLQAGAFTLDAKVSLPPLVENGQSRCRQGQGATSVEVAGGEEKTPLNAGDLTITVRLDLDVGQIAPPFEAPTLEGGVLRLADFRGKYVLLDFWATWCGPCVAQTPDLKEVFETFGSDERFAMIALSLDHTPKRPADYVKQHDLKWRQAFLGYWSASKVPADFGVHAIPQVMLLDPSGKVIAKDLRGEAIKRAVEEALK